MFFLELSYRSYLYRHHRGSGPFRFRNATRLLARYFEPAARPLGFRHPDAPAGFGRRWYHAAPSGLSRLWRHLGTNGSEAGIRFLYTELGLPAFRHDFQIHPKLSRAGASAEGATRSTAASVITPPEGGGYGGGSACSALRLISDLTPPWAASLQLDSISPGQPLLDACRPELPTPLPRVTWLEGVRTPPAHWRHRWEWFPD